MAIKNLLHTTPSTTSAFYRVFFSVIFILLFNIHKLKSFHFDFPKEIFRSGLIGLTLIGIPFALLFWGEQFISPSLAGVINGTVPLWTTIIGVGFFNQRKSLTMMKAFGLFVGFFGLCLIFYPKIQFTGDSAELFGLCSVIGMAIFYGIGTNLSNSILSKNKVITGAYNLVYQQLFALLFLTILMLSFDGVPDFGHLLNYEVAGSVLYLSLFSTAFAFMIFNHLVGKIGAIKTSTVTFFVPAISLLIDYVFYGTKLMLMEFVGAGIILLSMYFLKNRNPVFRAR